MAQGKTHDRFNLLIGAGVASYLSADGEAPVVVLALIAGWLIATLIFSPDSDFMPKKRTGPLQFILYPYAILFKHRGISHSFLFGTFTRVFYLFLVSLLAIFVLSRMRYLDFNQEDYLFVVSNYLKGYDYERLDYRVLTWGYLGMFMADLCHISLDHLSSFFKRLLPW